MHFGEALELLKRGAYVARFGWRDNEAIYLEKGIASTSDHEKCVAGNCSLNGINIELYAPSDEATFRFPMLCRLSKHPLAERLNMHMVETTPGYNLPLTDILANDWEERERPQ